MDVLLIMGKVKNLKTKEDRLKEGISLLTQLREAGVKQLYGGYQELKAKISEWVNTGEAWEGSIPFPEHGRVAEVELPKYDNRAAGLHFKVKKG
jgi:hypothetical protein